MSNVSQIWALKRNGYCEYMVPNPPHYFHRHQCQNKSKYRVTDTQSDELHQVCTNHKKVMERKGLVDNPMILYPAEPEKKRGRKPSYGRYDSYENLVNAVWLFYDAGKNQAQLARHMGVNASKIGKILNEERPDNG